MILTVGCCHLSIQYIWHNHEKLSEKQYVHRVLNLYIYILVEMTATHGFFRNQLIEIQYSEYVDLKNQTNLDLIIIFYHEDRSILQ
jgi:hypothetical protein